jgi:hypothetical protein
MKIAEIQKLLDAEAVQDEYDPEDITAGYTSDLLSDVMGNAPDNAALITIQAHKNTVAVATLAGIPVIVICNNRPVPEDMIAAARAEGIAILRTGLNQFRASGRLFQALAL